VKDTKVPDMSSFSEHSSFNNSTVKGLTDRFIMSSDNTTLRPPPFKVTSGQGEVIEESSSMSSSVPYSRPNEREDQSGVASKTSIPTLSFKYNKQRILGNVASGEGLINSNNETIVNNSDRNEVLGLTGHNKRRVPQETKNYHLFKTIAWPREEALPNFTKKMHDQVVERQFYKRLSVFAPWRQDTKKTIAKCLDGDLKAMKLEKLIKVPEDMEKQIKLIEKYMPYLKDVYLDLVCFSD